MIRNLEYKIYGDGEVAVVLLHGWGMTQECFDTIVPLINRKYKILTLDFFGFGKSDLPSEYFDTYEYAYQTYLILKELNLSKVILVGHSFGGRVSLLLESLFDIEILGVCLIASAGINKIEPIKMIKIGIYKTCKKLVKLKLMSKSILNKFGSRDFKNVQGVMRQVFVKVVNQDLRYLLNKITAKNILIWDKKDKVTKFNICRTLNRRIKNSEVFCIKNGGGHFAFIKNPHKIVNIINNI